VGDAQDVGDAQENVEIALTAVRRSADVLIHLFASTDASKKILASTDTDTLVQTLSYFQVKNSLVQTLMLASTDALSSFARHPTFKPFFKALKEELPALGDHLSRHC
jgi:hypothetical protein